MVSEPTILSYFTVATVLLCPNNKDPSIVKWTKQACPSRSKKETNTASLYLSGNVPLIVLAHNKLSITTNLFVTTI